MRRDERAGRPQRASSQTRRQSSVPRQVDTGPPRPASRMASEAGGQTSPNSEAPSLPSGRPSPVPEAPASGRRYSGAAPHSREGRPSSHASYHGDHGAHGAPRPTAAFAAPSSRQGPRPSSLGARAERGPAAGRGASAAEVTRTAVFGYLKVHGLNQYARAFIELGFCDLEAIGKLSEQDALEFLDRLRIYPGHRLRLLRAIDCLRHAAQGAERRDAAQMLEDDAALDRLCAQNENLSKEKTEAQGEMKKLQEENARLIGVIREQDDQLQKAKARVSEMEDMLKAQTEQVAFLTSQLQTIAEEEPGRDKQLYRSYRESFDDWGEAEKLHLPDTLDLSKDKTADLSKVMTFMAVEYTPKVPPASAPGGAARMGAGSAVVTETTQRFRSSFVPPRRADLAKSLDSAQVRECLAGFDVDHIIRCLASALQNKMILTVSKPRPHSASPEALASCAVFLEPACRDKLLKPLKAPSQLSLPSSTTEESSMSFCSPLMSRGSDRGHPHPAGGSENRLSDPLNNLAVRTVPNKWDIYGFLRDVMVNFRLEPEVSVVTLFYLERFGELSGVALTPDNWQRLTITSMMLASKVWNDESFENVEFSQLCPLYTLDEINAFERIFLKSVGYRMSVKGSEYAKTYFLLRTLGAKDNPDFIEPISDKRATRLTERCLEKQMEFKEKYPVDDPEMANIMNWTM